MELFRKNKAIVAAMSANFVIALMKFAVALFSRSASMFSEAVHSAADTLNQVVLLLGKHRAGKAPDQKHPFGYARATFFASFLVASLLFFVGGAFSLFEAVEKIKHVVEDTGVHELDQRAMLVAAGVLLVSIVLEIFSFKTALHEVKEDQEREGTKRSLWRFYRETNNASLIVVVTEDLAAIIGLSLAFAGVLATLLTGNPLYDAVGGAAVGVLLIAAAFVLGKEVASLIIGEALYEDKLREIERAVESVQGVKKCRQIKSDALGNDVILTEIDAEFESADTLTASELIEAIEEIKRRVKALPQHEGVYVSTCVEPVRAEKYAPGTGGEKEIGVSE